MRYVAPHYLYFLFSSLCRVCKTNPAVLRPTNLVKKLVKCQVILGKKELTRGHLFRSFHLSIDIKRAKSWPLISAKIF